MDRALTGIPASPGIVVGPVHLLRWEVPDVATRIIPDDAIPAEIARFDEAVERAKERLAQVRDRAASHAGPEEAAIFDVQISILDDHDLGNQVRSYIRQNLAAEKAFDVVLHEWRARFAHHASPMMRERVGDLTDVHIRVLSILLGLPDHDPVDVPKGAKAILVTHDLTPSLTVQLDRDAIAGLATDAGTRTSHVAILARSLGLPALRLYTNAAFATNIALYARHGYEHVRREPLPPRRRARSHEAKPGVKPGYARTRDPDPARCHRSRR